MPSFYDGMRYTQTNKFYKSICAIRGIGSTRGIACVVRNAGEQVPGQQEQDNTRGSVRLVTSSGCIGEHELQSVKVHRYSRTKMRKYKFDISNIIKIENFSSLLVNGNGNDFPKRLCVYYLQNEEQKTDFTVYTISASKGHENLTLEYDQNTERHNLNIPSDRFDFFLNGSPIIKDERYFVGVLKESDRGQFNPCFITEEEFEALGERREEIRPSAGHHIQLKLTEIRSAMPVRAVAVGVMAVGAMAVGRMAVGGIADEGMDGEAMPVRAMAVAGMVVGGMAVGGIAGGAMAVGAVAVGAIAGGTMAVVAVALGGMFVGGMAVGALTQLLNKDPRLVENAIRRALERLGLQVRQIRPGSILVDLHCNTNESFISFMEDFKTRKVKQWLEEEFKRIGYEGELKVVITNDKEVQDKLDQIIRKLERKKSKDVKGETPVGVAEKVPFGQACTSPASPTEQETRSDSEEEGASFSSPLQMEQETVSEEDDASTSLALSTGQETLSDLKEKEVEDASTSTASSTECDTFSDSKEKEDVSTSPASQTRPTSDVMSKEKEDTSTFPALSTGQETPSDLKEEEEEQEQDASTSPTSVPTGQETLSESREILDVKAGNSDSDDEWDNGSTKGHNQSEKQLQTKKGDEEHISKETSTNKGPGDSFGDLENAVSVISFSPIVALPGKPGCSQEESLTAEACPSTPIGFWRRTLWELTHCSLVRWTWIRGLDIASRLNWLTFNYTLSVMSNTSSSFALQDELALLFVSESVYHEEFYHEQESSAVVKLTEEKFTKLHVSTIGTQEEKRICNSDILQVNIHLGEDYKFAESKMDFKQADSQSRSIKFSVESKIWWNEGWVIRLPLGRNKAFARLCGKISVNNGKNGHTKEFHFSEKDLPGYVRNLLGVEEAIFNVIPIAKSVAKLLKMPEKSMNEVTTRLIMKDEDEQLGIILKQWSGKKNVVEDFAALRNELEKLKQEDYKVTPRGQMHIRHLREFATKKADSRIFRTLCKSLLSDLCIELECSAEGVERAASSTNHADFFLVNHSTKNHQPIPEDIARKYEQVCSSSEELCLQTFLDITPYLIQNVKEIFVGHERIVPQNGLRGLSENKIVHFVSNILNAERNEDIWDLVFLVCQILEQLCLKNPDKQTTAEIKEWAENLEIPQMLKSLTCFFQHSQHDVRLHKRLYLFSRHLRDIRTKRLKSDDVDICLHDFSNISLSLIHFSQSDSSKLIRFELTDSANSLVLCSRENMTYDKHENTYSQGFHIKKQSEGELQLRAIANVSIDRRICKKGAFQSVIMLNASGQEAFDACMKRFDIAVMKLEDKSSGSLRLVLCSTQKEKLVEALNALKRDLNEDLLDLRQSEITQCHLQMRSINPAAGVVLRLRLVYKWGSEAVTLDSSDFMTFADSSAGGACIPEVKFQELHLHQTVNQMTGHVCVAGDRATVNEQMPSQLAFPEGPSAAPKRSITEA